MKRALDAIGTILCLLMMTPGQAMAAGSGGVPCLWEQATIVGHARGETLRGTPGNDVIAGRGGDDLILGMGGDDILCGGDGDDVLKGAGGVDAMDGGGGDDELRPGGGELNVPVIGGPGDDRFNGREGVLNVFSYRDAPRAVTVDLAAGTATGWGNDTLVNFNEGDGSAFDDVLIGNEGPNGLFGFEGDDRLESGGGPVDFMVGEGGNDTLIGEGSTDIVGYEYAPEPVVADIAAGTATGDGSDALEGIDIVFGSYEWDDQLMGDDGDNAFHGYGGNDTIDGRGGTDMYTFSQAPGPVVADLVTGEATGEGEDSLAGIEDVIGSTFDDELRGTDGSNFMLGLDGDDQLYGLGGDDALLGDGDGFEFPDPENDSLDGGDGNDVCFAGENLTDCESTVWARSHYLSRVFATYHAREARSRSGGRPQAGRPPGASGYEAGIGG